MQTVQPTDRSVLSARNHLRGTIDEIQPADQRVPGPRDAAPSMFLAARVLARHEADIRHQRAGRLKPSKVMQLGSRTLLIVEDDTPLRDRLVRAVRDRGYETLGVPDYASALEAAREESPELALVDLRLPGESGLTVIRDLKQLDPSTVVVVLTGYGSIATAVESIKLGAASYLTKPADATKSWRRSTARNHKTMLRCPRWLGSNGSTSNVRLLTVEATCRKLRGHSASIDARFNESCRSTPVRGSS